jgi:transcriptional regulator with XRE-family HTH domain
VPERGSLKIGRRRLATELRVLRELAGLTGEEVAERLGWSGSKISRIELNRSEVKSADLARLLDLYGVAETQRGELLALTRSRRRRGWWEAYSEVVPPEFAAYIELESEAETIRCWSPQLVHGLLQTRDYAEATIMAETAWMPLTPPGHVRQLVEVRVGRQRAVTEQTQELQVVLDESVLRRGMGGPRIMRAQLGYLADVSQLPNLCLRVLPLDGPHPVNTGAFILLSFPPVAGIGPPANVFYVEQLTRSEVFTDREDEANSYHLAFGKLAADALDPGQSRDLIARVARQLWSS